MIVVNGKSYSSLDEMPPEVRQEYEQAMGMLADKDQDGLPDVFEGMLGAGNVNVQTPTVVGSTQFVVDGKVYSSVDELPLDARQKYDRALGKMGPLMSDANQNGMPDIFDSMFSTQPAPSTPPAASTPATTPSRPLLDETPTDNVEATPNYRGTLIFAGIVIVVLLIVLLALGAYVLLPQIK